MSAKTTKQQEALTELLDLLTQNGKKQEAAELSALFAQFSAMETQYGKVLSELSAVREQLATLHDGGNRTAAMQETKQTQAHITQAKETLSHLKEDMTDRIRKTLAAVKQHGISALNKAADFLGIKKALAEMKGNVQDAIASTQGSIDRINAIGSELHALNEHAKNLGRALTGKERKELTQRNEDKGVLAAIAKPLKRHKATLEGMEKNIDRAMARVERLEQAAAKGREKEKPSIREEIKAAKKPEQEKKQTAPQKTQEASL
jgi:septal ring factor EnvC (AmiA/AmiB activator)